MGTLPAGRSDVKPTRVRLRVLAFVCTLSLLTYLDRVCISQAQRDIQFDLRICSEDMGLVLGVFAVGYALFEIPEGWMGDRWGARRVLTGLVLFWSLFTALTGAADFLLRWTPGFDLSTDATTVLFVLVTIRFLFGSGEAGAFPNIDARRQRLVPVPRARRGPGRGVDVGPAGRGDFVRNDRGADDMARLAAGVLRPGAGGGRVVRRVSRVVPQRPGGHAGLQPGRARPHPRRGRQSRTRPRLAAAAADGDQPVAVGALRGVARRQRRLVVLSRLSAEIPGGSPPRRRRRGGSGRQGGRR